MKKDYETRQEKARNLRYKHAALESMGSPFIWERLNEIVEACDDVQYFMDSDGKTLLDALDGDDEQVYEFKMMFADLSGDAYRLQVQLTDAGFNAQDYDDTTVGMIGNRFEMVGYDSFEVDYFHLVGAFWSAFTVIGPFSWRSLIWTSDTNT